MFGYLFAGVVARDALHSLHPRDALWSGLFNARAIEDHRWRVVATSLRFERERWPMPHFAVREPFGRKWSQRTLHDETLATIATGPSDEIAAGQLPDARIYEPEHLERLIDDALDSGGVVAPPLVVIDVHPPLDAARLRTIPQHARVQSGESLGTRDTASLANVLNDRDDVALRLYGSVDRTTLLEIVWLAPELRRLEIDVPLDTLALLYPLARLEALAVRRAIDAELPLPERFASLRELTLRGTLVHRHIFRELPALRRLRLQAAGWESAAPLHGALHLRDIEFSDMPMRDLRALHELRSLRSLRLRRCDLASLDVLRGLPVESLTIENLPAIADLDALRELPHLRALSVRGMPHLNVRDFRVLTQCASLRVLSVDLGSRSKNREIYRMAHPQLTVGPAESTS